MESLLVFSHILGGAIVLLIGLTIIIIKKGSSLHKLLGWIYVIAMWIVSFSAISIITFYRFNLFLLVIAIYTFYATFSGFRTIQRRKSVLTPRIDYLVSSIVFVAGLILNCFGCYILVTSSNVLLAGLSIIFGFFIGLNAFRDLRFYSNGDKSDPNWWLYQHISAMGGSYIAAVSAFAVQNGDFLELPDAMAWMPWILPGVVGTPIITKAIRKIKSQHH